MIQARFFLIYIKTTFIRRIDGARGVMLPNSYVCLCAVTEVLLFKEKIMFTHTAKINEYQKNVNESFL